MPIKIKGSPVGAEYAQHLTAKPTVATTKVEKKHNGQVYATAETVEQLQPGVQVPLDEYALVGIAGGRTFNLGDFNSCKVEVSLQVACTKATIDEAFAFIEGFVQGKVAGYIAEAESGGDA